MGEPVFAEAASILYGEGYTADPQWVEQPEQDAPSGDIKGPNDGP